MGVAEVVILALVEGLIPALVALVEESVEGCDRLGEGFVFEGLQDEFVGGEDGVGAVVEALAVEGVHEACGVADAGPAVAADLGGVVGEVGVGAHVGADGFGMLE